MNISRYSTNCHLRRLGKKNVIANELMHYIPDSFDCLISLFYGTGSFENNFIGKIKFLFANDLDSNVFNLFNVLKNNCEELIENIEMLPIGTDSWNYYKKYHPTNNIEKAVRFLYLSNFGYLGKPNSLNLGLCSNKNQLLKNLKEYYKSIVCNKYTEITYTNLDYEKCLNNISLRKIKNEKEKVFIFADPPYVGTCNNYDTPEFTIADHEKLQKVLINHGSKFMICEFDNKQVIDIAKSNNLFITNIKERRNMNSDERQNEIIITNYPTIYYKQIKMF